MYYKSFNDINPSGLLESKMKLKNTTLNKRFTITNIMYEDLFAIRYGAIDSGTKNNVSIKMWKFPITERLMKIKGNLEKISNYNFENVLNLIHYDDYRGNLYGVHEFIEGISLYELIRQGSRISIEDMIHLLESLIISLKSLHSNGITHGGIKPSNIIIPFHDNYYLMDNAYLSDPLQSRILYINDPVEEKTIRESVYTLAPESIIASGAAITPESDQYSLGVLFYFLISGHYPHENEDISHIIYSHTSSSYKPLEGAPDYVNEILKKLMEKKPEDRYKTVKSLSEDFTIKNNNHRDVLSGYYNDLPEIDTIPSFTGRSREMKILKSALYDLVNGDGTACFTTGPNGCGKTRFIKEFLKHAEALNVKYMYYSSSEQRNRNKPYALVSAVLEEYLVFFRSYDREKQNHMVEKILQGIEKISPLLLKIDPAFEELIGKPIITVRPLEGDRDKQRFEMLINRFIHNIAEAENGLILVVDDIETADKGSLELTSNLMPHVSENKILFIATANIENNINIDKIFPSIQNLDAAKEQFLLSIHIEKMNQEDHRAFIARVLHSSINIISTIADFIHQKSSGIPYLSIEITKELYEQRILSYENKSWKLNHDSAGSFTAPESIFSQLLKSTAKLDRNEKQILSIASVFLYKIKIESLKKYITQLTNLENEIDNILETLLKLGYLEMDVTDHKTIMFCDSRIREIFYRSLENETKQVIHQQIAQEIQNFNDIENNFFEIAHHYINSSNKDKATYYSLKAGHIAMNAYLYEDALNYFSYCLEDTSIDASIRTEASISSSLIHINLGHYQNAISNLEDILPAASLKDKPEIFKILSIAYYKISDYTNSERNGIEGLEILKEKIHQKRIPLFFKTVQQFITYYIIKFFHLGSFSSSDEKKKTAKTSIDIMKNLCWNYMVYNIPKFIYVVMRTRTLAGRYLKGMTEEAISYEVFAGMLLAARRFNKAEKYLWKAIHIYNKSNYDNEIYQSHKILGFAALWKCQFEQSIKHFNEAIKGFQSNGDISEIMSTYPPLFDAYGLQARYKDAEEILNKLHDYSLSNNDISLLTIAVYNRMLLAIEQGSFEEAKEWSQKTLDLLDDRDPQRICIAYTGVGYYYLMTENYKESLNYFDKAKEVFDKNNFLGQYTVNLFCFKAEAAIRLALQEESINDPNLYTICKEALRKTKTWPTHYGKALRSMGMYYSTIGSYSKAVTYFNKSIKLNEKNHIRFELARSIYELAKCEEKFNHYEESKSLYERSYIIFDDIDSQHYTTELSLLLGLHNSTSNVIDNVMARKRLHLFMNLIHQLRKKDNEKDILESILHSSINITSSEFGIIFLTDDNEDRLNRVVAAGKVISDEIQLKSLAVKTFNSRRIDFIDEMNFSEIREHLLRIDDFSVKMAIPIFSEDEILGICCLEKKLNKNEFTFDEFSLINMLLFQCGVLLENMRLKNSITEGRYEKKKENITESTESKIREVINYLQNNYIEDVSREGLAALVDIHPDHLGKMFKVYSGMKMSDYINELRVRNAAEKLENSDSSVIDIAFSVGFESLRTFNRAFTKFLGTSPRNYREKNHKGN